MLARVGRLDPQYNYLFNSMATVVLMVQNHALINQMRMCYVVFTVICFIDSMSKECKILLIAI